MAAMSRKMTRTKTVKHKSVIGTNFRRYIFRIRRILFVQVGTPVICGNSFNATERV